MEALAAAAEVQKLTLSSGTEVLKSRLFTVFH